jgi:hypothetical protein
MKNFSDFASEEIEHIVRLPIHRKHQTPLLFQHGHGMEPGAGVFSWTISLR